MVQSNQQPGVNQGRPRIVSTSCDILAGKRLCRPGRLEIITGPGQANSPFRSAGGIMTSETWSLVEALRGRSDLAHVGRAALVQAFPEAPPAMLDTAAFHLFTDGCGAAAEWLATLERFLRQPDEGLDFGATWHLLYHLYNWLQVEALLP